MLHYIIQRIQFYEQHKEKQAFPLKMEQRSTFLITNHCMSSGIICEKINKQICKEVKKHYKFEIKNYPFTSCWTFPIKRQDNEFSSLFNVCDQVQFQKNGMN